MLLTKTQIAEFASQGFLVLKDFVSAEACDSLRKRGEALVQDFDPKGVVSIFSTRQQQSRLADEYFLGSGDKIRFFFEADAFLPDGSLKQPKERSINKIGHALHDLDPIFNSFSRTERLRILSSELEMSSPLLLQSMYIFKQPHIGGEVTCHQDSTFLYTEPIDILGLWFALEDATIQNGCLWVIPGGHRLGLKSRWVRADEGGMRFEIFDETPFPEAQLVPLEVSKGTLLILHGLIPHKSLPNRSSKSRHAYTLHLIGSDCHYPDSNWLRRSREMPLSGFQPELGVRTRG